ncbi:MAG: hypothetical protein R8K22_08095 [Mariprofundaceae bacterium]
MQGTSADKAKKLMETVSFELDTNLRLHAQKLELGKAELLTDALTLPFTDIEKRLNQYITGASDGEKLILQKSMKSYLAKLNSNPMIPLHFRTKVLNRFERELELFDSEMTAAVLNAHKIGVDLVQKAARSEPAYYKVLVEMVASALELAIKMLRIGLENYQSPAVITIRQAFDLMRLGLSVLPALKDEDISEASRLKEAVSNHELLRMLDFYGRSPEEQLTVWEELQHHIGTLAPVFLRKNEASPSLPGETFIITNTVRPNDAGKIESKPPEIPATDLIIIPVDPFIDRLVTAVNRVETVLASSQLQQHDLHTEEALHTTILGGNAILDTMRSKNRNADREAYAGVKVIVEEDAGKAFTEAHTALALSSYEYAPSERVNPESWSVTDVSQQGVGLERLIHSKCRFGVGAIIGLNWIPHKGEDMMGTVRWIKEPKPGEQKIGVEFFKYDYKLYKGAVLGGDSGDMSKGRSWPVLIKPGKPTHTAVFPDSRILKGLAFLLSKDSKSAHFKVQEVIERGRNYTICKVLPSKDTLNAGNMDTDR